MRLLAMACHRGVSERWWGALKTTFLTSTARSADETERRSESVSKRVRPRRVQKRECNVIGCIINDKYLCFPNFIRALQETQSQRSCGIHWHRGKCPHIPAVLCYRTYLHPWGRRIALMAGWSWNNNPALQVTHNKADVLCSLWFDISSALMASPTSHGAWYISTADQIHPVCAGEMELMRRERI